MRLTIAYSKIKKRNLVLINNDTHQRETLSERPIRPPLTVWVFTRKLPHILVFIIMFFLVLGNLKKNKNQEMKQKYKVSIVLNAQAVSC